MTTQIYRNTDRVACVIMDGECLGLHLKGRTCVRRTTDGKFAVISTTGERLIEVFDNEMHARRYNFAIHGEKL